MSQLHRTLYSLKDAHLVIKWEPFSKSCATLWVTNDKSFNVCIGDDYYEVTLSDVMESVKKSARLDYVIVSAWQSISSAAEEFCKEKGIQVVTYSKFRQILHEIHGI